MDYPTLKTLTIGLGVEMLFWGFAEEFTKAYDYILPVQIFH